MIVLSSEDTRLQARQVSGRLRNSRGWNPRSRRGRSADEDHAKQRGAFDVGRAQQLAIASGDRILIRSREDSLKFQNGDVAVVARVDPERDEVMLQDGRSLPRNFQAWTYAHAVTSYRSQGSTSEESILVLGEVAERALSQRQFYVGNTRYRGAHRIYVSHREACADSPRQILAVN